MKRSGFRRKIPERKPLQLYRLARPCPHARVDDTPRPTPKEEPARSEEYRRLVAALPCLMCGRPGPTQAAHPNTGKGLNIKVDDRLCFPLCPDEPGRRGCHSMLDQGAAFEKEARRTFEQRAARMTQERIEAEGNWPEGLPRYSWQA